MTRKFLYCILLIVLSFEGFSQFSQRQLPPNLTTYDDAAYHFGFTLSLSSFGMNIKTVDDYYNVISLNKEGGEIDVDYNLLPNNNEYKVISVNGAFISPGFAVGIVCNLRLGEYFDFRVIPGLSFSQQRISYGIIQNPNTGNEKFLSGDAFSDKVECVFLDFPVLLKYKGKRIHNVRPYIIGGFEGKINFLSGVGYENNTANELSSLKLDAFDLMGTFGAGLDFYMFWFKLGIELRMGYSFFDTHDNLGGKHFCTNAVESIKAKQFQVVFTFE